MRSRKTLLALSLILMIAAFVVPSASLIAAKPPPPIPVTATYRDDSADALRSDGGGSYAGSLAADGSRLTISASGHPFGLCYYRTTPFDDGGDCLEGDLPDGFSICGGGEIVVTPHLESFFDMSNEEAQPADATTRIIGDDNFRYFVRFKPTDTLVSDPNCSTPVTLKRIDANHWEIEGFAGDVARVLTHKIRGGPGGYTNRGHYLAPFKISLSSQP